MDGVEEEKLKGQLRSCQWEEMNGQERLNWTEETGQTQRSYVPFAV